MKLFTEDVRLSINAVKALVGAKGPVKVADLAVPLNTTVPYLEQIMRKLRLYGLVKSVRGPGGGYVLAEPFITDGLPTLFDYWAANKSNGTIATSDRDTSSADGKAEYLALESFKTIVP